MSNKMTKPFKVTDKGVTIEANYSKSASNKELIKFTKDGVKFELSADSLLGLIGSQFKTKSFALTLTGTDMYEIPMVEAIRHFNFAADKAYAVGDTITVEASQPYPYVLAALEKAYGTCLIKGDMKMLPISTYEETLQELVSSDENKKFIEEFYKITQVKNEKGRKDN